MKPNSHALHRMWSLNAIIIIIVQYKQHFKLEKRDSSLIWKDIMAKKKFKTEKKFSASVHLEDNRQVRSARLKSDLQPNFPRSSIERIKPRIIMGKQPFGVRYKWHKTAHLVHGMPFNSTHKQSIKQHWKAASRVTISKFHCMAMQEIAIFSSGTQNRQI